MNIEEEIKQSKFSSVHHKAHLNIIFTAYWLISQTKSILKPYGITHQQFNVLKILKGQHPNFCTAFDIKERMLDKSPDLTRLLDRLIKKELVTRAVCEKNRRKLDIGITQQGLTLLKQIEPQINKQLIKQTHITEQEAIELSRIIDKLRG